MKLNNLPSDEEGFCSYPIEFCGIDAYLIIPEISAKWNKNNLMYRSLIVRGSDFEVLSSGWPKFFNFGEKPDAYPNPESYRDWNVGLKLDGSLAIVDYVNDQFNIRTRGTASYISQDNAEDFEQLLHQHPKLVEWMKNIGQSYSLLFEILTPNNVIVIRSEEVKFIFLGAIDKRNMSVISSTDFNNLAAALELTTPEQFPVQSLEELVATVREWKGKEGIVLSFNKNQNRIKIKGDWYLQLHRIKSELNSENNLIEFYVSENMPSYQEFFHKIETTFDWEIANQLTGQISKLANAAIEVKRIISHMEDFVKTIKTYSSRKEQALAIINSYGGERNSRSGMLFTLLDGKELTKDQIIKLFWQVLKK